MTVYTAISILMAFSLSLTSITTISTLQELFSAAEKKQKPDLQKGRIIYGVLNPVIIITLLVTHSILTALLRYIYNFDNSISTNTVWGLIIIVLILCMTTIFTWRIEKIECRAKFNTCLLINTYVICISTAAFYSISIWGAFPDVP